MRKGLAQPQACRAVDVSPGEACQPTGVTHERQAGLSVPAYACDLMKKTYGIWWVIFSATACSKEGLVPSQAWNAGNVSPSGRSRRSVLRVAALVPSSASTYPHAAAVYSLPLQKLTLLRCIYACAQTPGTAALTTLFLAAIGGYQSFGPIEKIYYVFCDLSTCTTH